MSPGRRSQLHHAFEPSFAQMLTRLLARSLVCSLAIALLAGVGVIAIPDEARAQSWAGDARTGSGAPARSTPQARAQDALQAGEAARALQIVEQAMKTFPADAQLRFLRGLALSGLKRWEEAEAVFRGLTQEYPELPEPHNNLAYVLAAQGKLEAARGALEAAIAALPDYALAHENLGDIQLQLAARSYRDAVKLDPRADSPAARSLQAIERLQATNAPGARH